VYSFLLNLITRYDARLLIREAWIFLSAVFTIIDFFILSNNLSPQDHIFVSKVQLAIIPLILYMVNVDIARTTKVEAPRWLLITLGSALSLSLLILFSPSLVYSGGRYGYTAWYYFFFALCSALGAIPIILACKWLLKPKDGSVHWLELAIFMFCFVAMMASAMIDGSDFHLTFGGKDFLLSVYAIFSLAIFGIVTNVYRYKRIADLTKYLAVYDDLTDTLKRKSGIDEIERRIGADKGGASRFSVILFDLNNFKKMNDMYGYNVGNICLTDIAKQLKGMLARGDVLCRTEGDEFMIVADGVHESWDGSPLLSRIANDFNNTWKIDNRVLIAYFRIGVSVYPEHGRTASELLKNADDSQLMAKDLHGRKLVVYNSALAAKKADAYQTEERLKETLREEPADSAFVLHYQPKVDSSGTVQGVEALLRWRYRGKLHYPDGFISVAEKTGLIHEMGNIALREGCRSQALFREMGYPDLSVSINLSPQQLNDPGITRYVLEAVEGAGATPSKVELELTESSVMDFWNSTDACAFLQGIRDRGIKISIDDFGTGHSSFSRLLELPADVLKIDRSFVTHLPEQGKSRQVCLTIITLAHQMGMTVVAEGVETEGQADYLFSIGCDLIQGYYFHKPMALPDLERILSGAPASVRP
jgi:diguanylate cyclase (GGDEF)-like protein